MLVHIWSVKKLRSLVRRKTPASLKAFWLINKNTKTKVKKKIKRNKKEKRKVRKQKKEEKKKK